MCGRVAPPDPDMPVNIQQHLPVPQVLTIVAHEVRHIRRRDNLTACIHMVVESIFWFHPLVWWIVVWLIEERDGACDEHVVRTLGERLVYTHAIVNICRRYAESPLVCASGVGGSSIRKRIDAILNDEVGELLGPI